MEEPQSPQPEESASINDRLPQDKSTPKPDRKNPLKWLSRKQLLIAAVVIVLLVAGGVAGLIKSNSKQQKDQAHFDMAACIKEHQKPGEDPHVATDECTLLQNGGKKDQQASLDLGDVNSIDPVEKGKALSGGLCEGTGSKKLGSAPMRTEQMSIIVPYGLLAGGHVTPVDHQYYWGKNQFGPADSYDVLAPADGTIVAVQYRDRSNEGKAIKGDYRVVISYSCTFFSYFDLATSLSDDIVKQMGGKPQAGFTGKIPVKEGQVVGKVGGQSLDFAVWDTTKQLKHLLVPEAYNVAEPWKIVTVPPLDYFTDAVKQKILPLYGRSAEPRDGVIDQDIDGKLVGNWFVEGTYGYAGSSQFQGGEYYKGHLAIVRDLYDTDNFMFSIGDFGGQATQFAIKNPSVTPDKADKSSGVVKYDLAQISYVDETGWGWRAEKPVKSVQVMPGQTKGTALVQMLEDRKIKVEVFPGKSPSQVSGFTSAAKTYTRGEDAKNAAIFKH